MTIFRLRSKVLRDAGHKFETTDEAAAKRKLIEVKRRDPNAKLIRLEV